MSLFLIRALSYFTINFLTALTICIVSAKPLRFRPFLATFGILFVLLMVNVLFLPVSSPLRMVFAMVGIIVVYLVVYRFSVRKTILTSFIALAIEFGGDIITGTTFLSLFSSDTIGAMRNITAPSAILLQAVCGVTMVALALLYRMFLAWFQHRKINQNVGYLLRPFFLMVIICMIYFNAFRHATQADENARFLQMLPDFLIAVMLMIIGVTYMLQDIKAYKQAQENKNLQHQQSLQATLLQDTRVFRHNISNMLYGFQGTLLSGDMAAVEAYYKTMTESCQLINNENVLALKRLPSAAVSTLLLHKIHAANEQKIPFYANVQENIDWFGLKDDEMVQILGVLLDNALEATKEAAAPMVIFDARNEEDALSITICNTYPKGELLMFTPDMTSTKEGHEGLGLKSVHTLLQKHSNVLLNIYTRGRYVEASLMIYK